MLFNMLWFINMEYLREIEKLKETKSLGKDRIIPERYKEWLAGKRTLYSVESLKNGC